MKFFVFIIIIINTAVSSGKQITIPGDKNRYVDNKSSYIWMLDGEGTLTNVDETLNKAARDGSDNQYWLYTRQNPDTYQLLVHGDTNSVLGSNYLATRQTVVIVHGWNNNGYSNVNALNKPAFLSVLDCNVIVVDWSYIANSLYPIAAAGVPSVGEYLGNFLIWLFNTFGGDRNTLHIVGFSLGAHAAGNAGRVANALPRRITGLDPAGPLWVGNSLALDKLCGQYVEVIHTDAGEFGILENIGHADFYPNGGKNPQPGCWNSVCSHSFSYEVFASTVYNDDLVGSSCIDVNQAVLEQCTGSITLNMGNAIITKTGSGIYGLTTGPV